MCRSGYIQHAKCSSFTAKIHQIRWNFSSLLSTKFRQTVALVGASGYSPTQGSLYPCCPQSAGYSTSGLYALYRTFSILTTYFSKIPENSATDNTAASYASPDCSGSSPPLPLLMPFIGQNTIRLQAGRVLKAFTGKSTTFKHIETTVFGCVLGNIKYSTNS